MAKYFNHIIFLSFVATYFVLVTCNQGVKNSYPRRHTTRVDPVPTNVLGYCTWKVPYHPTYPHQNRTRDPYNTERYPSDVYPTQRGWNDTVNTPLISVVECCENYYLDPDTNRCERNQTQSSRPSLRCQENCIGGECINGVCNCPPGWYESGGACKPICRRPCQHNAYCFSPDKCECALGYRESPYRECVPICPGGCADGECVAPRVCQCRPGYNFNDTTNRCDPICEGGCINGVCERPGLCSCDPGYNNHPRDRELCVPDCKPHNCDGGQCIAPGVCRCRSGYIQDHSTNRCVPECRNGCPINARCTEPDRCECSYGFEMDHYRNRCEHKSEYNNDNNNNNGGRNDHQTQGHCERPCINGVCMGYNICSCNDGYIQDPRDPTRTHCIASCPGGCINGVCSAPNFCICNHGYVKDRGTKGSQRCVPQYNY